MSGTITWRFFLANAIVLVALLFIAFVLGGLWYGHPVTPAEASPTPVLAPYVDHGNGVYEFPTVNEAFTEAIVAFLNDPDHAGLHCHLLADTYGPPSSNGIAVSGHLLQCHDASVYAQTETAP